MALTEIEYGALASSDVMNNNFRYLENQISNLSETVVSNYAGVNSNIASINNSMGIMQENLSSDIEKLGDEVMQQLSDNEIFVTTYINGKSWYKEYFSDSKKTNRTWLEQGGIRKSSGTTTFLKPFVDENYTLLLGTHCTYYEHGGIQNRTNTGFGYRNGKGWSYDVEWYACGK